MNLMVDVSTVTTHTHKKKTYSRYMEFIEKGIKAYHYIKSGNHKGRGKREIKEQKTAKQKTIKEMAIINLHLAIIITYQNKWTAFSSQKTE